MAAATIGLSYVVLISVAIVSGRGRKRVGLIVGASIVHALCVLLARGLPRWMGWPLIGAYVWFVAAGLM